MRMRLRNDLPQVLDRRLSREQNETPSVSATIDALYTDQHLRVRERIAMSHSISQTSRLTRPGEP